jgi:Gamma tubulin complex component C-terminal
MLAYIFTVTSGDYLQNLSQSVGYYGGSASNWSKSNFISLGFDLGEDDDQEDAESVSSDHIERFPSFISSDASEILIRARKSLKFLSLAQPDHPFLQYPASRRRVVWFWSDEEVLTAWDGKANLVDSSDAVEDNSAVVARYDSDTSSDSETLEQFKVFSLEPGTHFPPSTQGAETALQSFMANFPRHLSPLTPTLSHLSNLVISPLITHCTSVSGALISLLLSPGSHLHLHSHLVILRSYLLLTLPAFTRRLQAALFSDSDDWRFEGSTVRAMAKSTHNKKKFASGGSSAQWAVGLGLGLAERDSWPPGGSDLSYYLRTVIVDSLESLINVPGREVLESSDGRRRVFAEAEFRLGFIIRDLPAGSGRERWLNPSCEYPTLILSVF